ncbi:phosphoribosylpyrophosphate synthetase [Mucilaginibacter sp.]|uniref:phosphoribosylpyrophosphate synthetase n=1 Tax=Mucilaginibacter sp. TaxID=1882438 RepID=UPI003B00922C
MKNFETLLDALNDLISRGYTEDFNVDEDMMQDREKNIKMTVDEFEIDEFYRFEGESNPADMSILYGISSEKYNLKGTLVSAYGTYSSNQNAAIDAKLNHNQVNKNL